MAIVRWVDDWDGFSDRSTLLVPNEEVDVIRAQVEAVAVEFGVLGEAQTPSIRGWTFVTVGPGWQIVLQQWHDVVDDEEYKEDQRKAKERR